MDEHDNYVPEWLDNDPEYLLDDIDAEGQIFTDEDDWSQHPQ